MSFDDLDNENAMEASKSFENPTRFFELDFGLGDKPGEKSFNFELLLTGMVNHVTEMSEALIAEFTVVESDCDQIEAGTENSHYMKRDGEKKWAKQRAQFTRDFIAGTMGLTREDVFSAKERVHELLDLAAKEALEDEGILLKLKVTKRNYIKGPKSKDPGGLGYALEYKWSLA